MYSGFCYKLHYILHYKLHYIVLAVCYSLPINIKYFYFRKLLKVLVLLLITSNNFKTQSHTQNTYTQDTHCNQSNSGYFNFFSSILGDLE